MLISNKPEDLTDVIQQGGIVAYPTEAVFGLGCIASNEESIENILRIKKRSADKGLILIASHIEQLETYIQPLSKEYLKKICSTSLHPVTWLVPVKDHVSPLLTGVYDKLAIRIIQHPLTGQLCNQIDHPLVSTSANISNYPAALTTQQVKQQFSSTINCILDGQTNKIIFLGMKLNIFCGILNGIVLTIRTAEPNATMANILGSTPNPVTSANK